MFPTYTIHYCDAVTGNPLKAVTSEFDIISRYVGNCVKHGIEARVIDDKGHEIGSVFKEKECDRYASRLESI